MLNYQVAPWGFNAGAVGDTEPGFQDLRRRRLGYLDVDGDHRIHQATKVLVGDEIIALYFKRVYDRAVVALPVARYVASPSTTSDTGYAPIYAMRPTARTSTTSRRTRSTTTPTTGGLHGVRREPEAHAESRQAGRRPGTDGRVRHTGNYANYTDDQFSKGGHRHDLPNLRIYPAKSASVR